MTGYPISIEYDKNGVETKIVYPNGLTEEYRFDGNYNLKEIESANQIISYQYNAQWGDCPKKWYLL